jgi:hypothetical protein
VLGKETHIKIGGSLDKMVEIDFKQIEEFDDQNLFWTFLLPSKNTTRYVEFLQNGNAGLLNLCEVEIYGTKGKTFTPNFCISINSITRQFDKI